MTFNLDSAGEIETAVRTRCKPGTTKTQKQTVSRSSLALGPLLRFISRDYTMHRSRVTAKGLRLIVFAVWGLRLALYATSNRGIRVQARKARNP